MNKAKDPSAKLVLPPRADTLPDEFIKKLTLPLGKAEMFVYDAKLRGFGLRVRRNNRTWFVQYRVGGRGAPQRRLKIGTLEKLNLGDARAIAKEHLAKVEKGIDPALQKIEASAQAMATLGAALDDYLEDAQRRLKVRSYEEVRRHLRTHWKPLHELPLATVTRQEVAAQLKRIARASGNYAANRARAYLSAFFGWCIGEGRADVNPVVGTNKATAEVSRDRVLSSAELRAIWREVSAHGGAYSSIIKLLILTGQRREEVAAMRWGELDFTSGIWTLPKERAKNARAHEVPLSSPALSILEGVTRREKRELLFGEGRGPFSGWSNCKTRLDVRVLARLKRDNPEAMLEQWRVHDIRRTVATGMAELGVQPHVVEAVLNHVSGHKAGVAGIYNRATYGSEKRAALELWAAHVTALVGDREGGE